MSKPNNVILLPTASAQPQFAEPNVNLCNMLRDVLKMAESGQLQSFIGTGFVSNGHRLAVWADHHPNVYEMHGALGWLTAEYVNRHATGD